jgi:hypothetical protein
MKEQIEKVKTHVKDHKELYIGIGIGVAVTTVIAVVACNKVNVSQVVIGNNNHLEQTTLLIRRGHPGFVIKCNETGEVFASQKRAAEAMDLSVTTLARHLKGASPHVKGFTFQNLGEAI